MNSEKKAVIVIGEATVRARARSGIHSFDSQEPCNAELARETYQRYLYREASTAKIAELEDEGRGIRQ